MSAAAPPGIQKAKITPNLPVSYDEELAAEALAMSKRIGAPSGDLIRANKDKTFTLPSGDTTDQLEVVVVGFVTMNQFYEGKYDPKNIRPPVCMALGTEIALMKPFPQVPKVQDEGKGCAPCWANQWKSDGNGKACKNQRLLALLAPGLQAEGPLMLLKVSPTGTRFWDTYVSTVMTLTKKPPIAVVTKITFDQKSDYASLRFEVHGLNENVQEGFSRRAEAMTRLLTEPDFAPAEVAAKPA